MPDDPGQLETSAAEPERECNCLIPYLDGAGQHSPGCSIFTPEERAAHAEEARQRWVTRNHGGDL